jgi:hypothetical protein
MSSRLRALAAALVATGALLTTTAAGAGVPTTELDPADLPRGADIAIPHVDGTTFVDGDRRVAIDAGDLTLVGRSGRAFILGTSSRNGLGPHRILRLRPDDSTRALLRATPWSLTLSEDGQRLVHVRTATRRSSPVSVHSARSGKLVAGRAFPDYPDVLGMRGRRVLLTTWERGVFWWDTRSGRTTSVTARPGNRADLGHDLLATYTDDPYLDGCTVLSRLSRPGKVLWRSCTERVDEFGPDGRSMATIHILSDGVGPGRITLRSVRGTLRARYDAARWFGAVRWEDPDTVLLDTNGTQYAVVRCRLAACENATDPKPAIELRSAARMSQRDRLRTSASRTARTR